MRRRSLLVSTSAACVLLASPGARADVSSWLALGGGASAQIGQGAATPDTTGVFTASIGVGTSPRAPLVAGLLYRSVTYFTLGTDLGFALRLATGGFARGAWGVALDAGPLWRTWGGGPYSTFPLQGVLTLGAPWGFQLAVGGQRYDLGGTAANAGGAFAALEIDLLRLSVVRQGSTERWWPNPNPAGGREK